MASSFKPSSAGFRAMAVGEEIRAAVTAEAEKAKGIAVGLAQDFRVTGEYADSFEVSTKTTNLKTGFGSHEVAAGVVTNVAPYAAAVEYGNARDHRPHHVLTRTLDSLGG